jgi:hypothetical protein
MASLSAEWGKRTWAGSATHWLAVDPHTRAYAALESPLAVSIMSRLQSTVSATEDSRCLACHTNPSLANDSADERMRSLRSDGVSCESCHGDAGTWLHQHTTWTVADRAAGYDQSGMAKLFDLGERAVACTGCHVGAPADPARGIPVRDMNHDMIAAGHPRLNFDFAQYQHLLPRHWKETDTSPDFDVKAWLVGRAAHVESAWRLSADREERARENDPRTPWPEFADWNCVSCHHRILEDFPASSGKPQRPSPWPFASGSTAEDWRAMRVKFAAAPGAECQAFLAEALKNVPTERLDRDFAEQVYHALTSRERSRMKRTGQSTYDPAYDRLAKSLTLPRGNLDFRVSPETVTELKPLLK